MNKFQQWKTKMEVEEKKVMSSSYNVKGRERSDNNWKGENSLFPRTKETKRITIKFSWKKGENDRESPFRVELTGNSK